MNLPAILLWGFIATLLLTTTMAAGQGLGFSRMSIPFILGSMFTPNRDRALVVGFMLHLLNGWLFAFLYVFAFESLGWAAWWLGGLGGLAHGLFVLLVGMPMMAGLHPRMASERQGPTPSRRLQPPGFLALHYGGRTPLITLAAHAVYGTILGGFYRLAGT